MATLQSLTQEVNDLSSTLSKLLEEAGLPSPSFDATAPTSYPAGKQYEKIHHTRMALVDATQAVQDMARGPFDIITQFPDVVIYPRFVHHLDITDKRSRKTGQARSRRPESHRRVRHPQPDPSRRRHFFCGYRQEARSARVSRAPHHPPLHDLPRLP